MLHSFGAESSQMIASDQLESHCEWCTQNDSDSGDSESFNAAIAFSSAHLQRASGTSSRLQRSHSGNSVPMESFAWSCIVPVTQAPTPGTAPSSSTRGEISVAINKNIQRQNGCHTHVGHIHQLCDPQINGHAGDEVSLQPVVAIGPC